MSVLGTIGLVGALWIGAGDAVSVESDSACPSAQAVREALLALGGQEARQEVSVTVRGREGRLFVEFGWPGQPEVETREVAADADCSSRAQTAAVVIASWLGMLPQASLPSLQPAAATEVRYSKIVPPGTPEARLELRHLSGDWV
jgi:hypothetical protein